MVLAQQLRERSIASSQASACVNGRPTVLRGTTPPTRHLLHRQTVRSKGLHRRLLRLFVSRNNADRQRCVCGCLVAKVCFPISLAFSCFTAKIGRTISMLILASPHNVGTPSNVLVFSERSGVSFSFFG